MKVIFIKVVDNAQKLQTICSLSHFHFFKKEPLILMTPNQVVAKYIDELLWRAPAASFLPHGLANSEELITILQEGEAFQPPISLLNLGDKHSYSVKKHLYELWDETQIQKKELAEKKLLFYQNQGVEINFINPTLLSLTI